MSTLPNAPTLYSVRTAYTFGTDFRDFFAIDLPILEATAIAESIGEVVEVSDEDAADPAVWIEVYSAEKRAILDARRYHVVMRRRWSRGLGSERIETEDRIATDRGEVGPWRLDVALGIASDCGEVVEIVDATDLVPGAIIIRD